MFLCDEGPTLETLDSIWQYAPTFSYFDLYLYSARSTLLYGHLPPPTPSFPVLVLGAEFDVKPRQIRHR